MWNIAGTFGICQERRRRVIGRSPDPATARCNRRKGLLFKGRSGVGREGIGGFFMQADLEATWCLTDEQLYAMLAGELGRGFGPSDLSRMGRDMFENIKISAALVICSSETVRAIYKRVGGGSAEVASAVADCLAGYLQHVPLATVAVLIVRHGLPTLCPPPWPSKEE